MTDRAASHVTAALGDVARALRDAADALAAGLPAGAAGGAPGAVAVALLVLGALVIVALLVALPALPLARRVRARRGRQSQTRPEPTRPERVRYLASRGAPRSEIARRTGLAQDAVAMLMQTAPPSPPPAGRSVRSRHELPRLSPHASGQSP